MKIIFYGGKQAGMISLLTLKALGHDISCVIAVDEIVKSTAEELGLNARTPEDINAEDFVDYLRGLGAGLFVCCHGRQILRQGILSCFRAINIHPCLYKYKGANPIDKLLSAGETRASVGAHWMTEKVDSGEVIAENFYEIKSKTIDGVYNELYVLYVLTLAQALVKIEKSHEQ